MAFQIIMAYNLEHKSGSYTQIVNSTFEKWTNSHPDIFLMSSEGHKIYTQKFILRFYSPWISDMFGSSSSSSLSSADDEVGISLAASSNSIVNLMKVLTTGLAVTKVRSELVEVAEVARSIGIDFDNWQIGVKKKKPNIQPNGAPPSAKASEMKRPAPLSRQTLPNTIKIEKVVESVSEPSVGPTTKGGSKECNICGNSFKTRDNLERHIKSHFHPRHANKCNECGLSFKNQEQLQQHFELLHNGNAQPQSEDHSEEANLDEIVAEVEGGGEEKKVYACDQCEKTYGSSNHLSRHKVTHTGVKFACEFCDREFTRKDKLNKHKRDKHEDSVKDMDLLDKDNTDNNCFEIIENVEAKLDQEIDEEIERLTKAEEEDSEELTEDIEIPDEGFMLD